VPNYEYQCKTCEHQFEIWQAVGEAAPPCPECGAEVKKVFHPPRIHFKGSGFYITDLRAEKNKAKSSGEAKSEAASEAKSEAASEAKSESAGEVKSEAAPAKVEGKAETKTEAKPAAKAETAAA